MARHFSRGTKSDHVADGRQDVLFTFRRVSAELHLESRHTIVLFHQSLCVETRSVW